MEYRDRIALMAAILLAAKVQRGAAVDVKTMDEAVETAEQLSARIPD